MHGVDVAPGQPVVAGVEAEEERAHLGDVLAHVRQQRHEPLARRTTARHGVWDASCWRSL